MGQVLWLRILSRSETGTGWVVSCRPFWITETVAMVLPDASREDPVRSPPMNLLVRIAGELVPEGLREAHSPIGEFLPVLP